MSKPPLTWYEFFAGGGLVRIGLEKEWRCLFANDISPKKAAAYKGFFQPPPDFTLEDVAKLAPKDLPGQADLAWASFPCQDLSLAGKGTGLKGERSGTFQPFWHLMTQLGKEGRMPNLIVLENVVGTITSHGGRDFETLVDLLAKEGYRIGPLVINARLFLPQSRPRLFIVATRSEIPNDLTQREPSRFWHTDALRNAHANLPKRLQGKWIWWNLEPPARPLKKLAEIVEHRNVAWDPQEKTDNLLDMMSEVNWEKVHHAKMVGTLQVGTVFRRTRTDGKTGEKQQRAEARFDGTAGCLRTPAGGSSRQILLTVEKDEIKSRLLSPREAARLMGVPENYPLPKRLNEALHLFGDGVAVPVAAWLSRNLLIPLARA